MSAVPEPTRVAPNRVHIGASAQVSGVVSVPGSKSQTNRVLVLAALSDGDSLVSDAMVADDSRQMIDALRRLGVVIEPLDKSSRNWLVRGRGGDLPDVGDVVLDAGLAGTVMRFLSAFATLAPHKTTVTGQAPLLARPVGELIRGLTGLGADIEGAGREGDFPPVTVRPSRPHGGQITIDARRSSQFASALVAVAPYFAAPTELQISGLEARGYFDLTIEMMKRRGARIQPTDTGALVGVGPYTAVDEQVPGDASSASHIFTAAAATHGEVTVSNLRSADLQPDYSVLHVLEAFGCTVERHTTGAVTVAGPEELTPVLVDLKDTPDQLPNVAVLAALANGHSRIEGVGITRFHETDRIQAVETELAKLGVETRSTKDTLEVFGGTPKSGGVISTYHDHRLGMAFAALGLAIGNTTISGADCVTKTFPGFWDTIESVGAVLTREDE